MEDFTSFVKDELSQKIGIGDWRFPKYFDKPIDLGLIKESFIAQKKIIELFFSKVKELAQTALMNRDDEINRILFSEAPSGMTIEYHQSLPKCCWNSPIIYRTDQSLSGKIYEIQAPGSGWGDLYLYALCLKRLGYIIPPEYFKFPALYAENICNATGKETPHVFHMVDAASVPYSARYLQAITSNYIKYWGLNHEVKMDDLDCIISHSVISITTSNYFKTYLQKAEDKKIVFSTSPNLIYDEKAIYILPFHRKTKSFFPEEIRLIFPFTTFIENNGFFDENDNFVSLDSFIKRKPRDRKYYLKYGGPDTNRNWGSRTVFRLSGNDCERLLMKANALAQKGEIWLIQEDVSQNISDIFYPQDIVNILSEGNHIKISGYYGIHKLFGIKVMARHHFKVHGQEDTLVGLGI